MTQSILTLTRTTNGSAVTVQLAVTGSAVLGINYEVVTGVDSFVSGVMTVTIPANQLTKQVVLNSLNAVITTAKTVTFTIVDTPASIGITPKTETLTINVAPVGDVFGQLSIIPELAYSLSRRLNPNYSGAAFRVRKVVGGGEEQNIPFLGNGVVDMAALLAFADGGSLSVTAVFNMGSAGAAYNMTQTNNASQPLIVEMGAPVLRHGRLALKQTTAPLRGMGIPMFSLLGNGSRQFTINYIAGMEGTSNRVILCSQSSPFILGFYDNKCRVLYSNNTGNLGSTTFTPGQKHALKQYSCTTPASLSADIIAYENGIFYKPTGPSVAPNANLSTNGTRQIDESSNCFFSEFIASAQGDSWLFSLQIIENSQRIWFGLSTLFNKNFASVVAQMDFQDTGNLPSVVKDRSLNRYPITISGTAQISTVDPQFGTGCLLLSGGSNTAFKAELPSVGNELIVLADDDFTIQFSIKPSTTLTANDVNVFGLVYADYHRLIISNGNLSWIEASVGSRVSEAGQSVVNSAYTNFALRRSNGVLTIWRNGILTATNSTPWNSSVDFRRWGLGAAFYSQQFVGRIGYFRLTNRVALDCSVVPTQQFDYNTFD